MHNLCLIILATNTIFIDLLGSMPNNNILDLSYPERYTYTNCNNTSLELIKIIGGGHQWPGILTVWGGLGTINMDFYSPQIIWDFLDGKTCPQTTGTHEIQKSDSKKLIKIIDLMGRETSFSPNTILIYIYDDGSTEKLIIME